MFGPLSFKIRLESNSPLFVEDWKILENYGLWQVCHFSKICFDMRDMCKKLLNVLGISKYGPVFLFSGWDKAELFFFCL